MAFAGSTFRVRYASLNLTTGLTDVQLLVIRPDSTVDGPYTMTEEAGYPGIYYYDYNLTSVGEYAFAANSATLPHKFAKSVTSEIAVAMKPVADFTEPSA